MFKTANKRVGRHATEDDPIRRALLKQSCDLLVAGGYFRAKMLSLTPFDRVIGGLVWSITSSNVDIDVDILFEENSSIGERIRVSEQVVRSLQMMKCPFALQSFQIQGLDYESILPVLKWLIKQVIQTRSLTGNDYRTISMRTFDQKIGYKQPTNDENIPIFPTDEFVETSKDTVGDLATLYHQKRLYKRRQGAVFEDPIMKVKATLLEYHDKHIRVTMDLEQHEMEEKKAQAQQANKKGNAAANRGKSDVEEIQMLQQQQQQNNGINQEVLLKSTELLQLQEQNNLRNLESQMIQGDGESGFKINSNIVGTLLSMNTSELAAKDEYLLQETQAMNNITVNVKDQRELEEKRFNKQCDLLNKKIAEQTALFAAKDAELQAITTSLNEVEAEYNAMTANVEGLKEKLKELEAIENATENKQLLADLKRYVVLNESLKKDELAFKQSCKEQYGVYRKQIDDLLSLLNDDTNFTTNCRELEEQIAKDQAKLQRIKDVLYQRHLELLTIYHKIDEIPTRGELLQFEKRFSELYQITATKLIETRSYFTLYNTLQTTYSYLQQELTLLESILNNFENGMKTEKTQKDMQGQIKNILAVMNENIANTQQELDSESSNEAIFVTKHNKLMAKEREYYKLLQRFQEQCDLNAKLSKQVEQQQAAQ